MGAELCRKHFSSLVAAWLMPLVVVACGSAVGDELSGVSGGVEVGGSSNVGGGSTIGGANNVGGGANNVGGTTNSGGSAGASTGAGGTTSDSGANTGAGGNIEGGTLMASDARDGGNVRDASGADAVRAADGAVDRRSAGCGQAATGTSSYVRETITVAGTEREYFVWIPRTYMANQPYPVVFRWHGSTGNGTSGGLEIEASSRENAIIASPSGIGGNWSFSATGVDVQLFDMLLANLESRYCIDTGRIYQYGFSAGGGMSNLLGCIRGDVVRAVAPVEGFLPSMPTCRGPVAAWITHSPDDTVEPIALGIATRTLFLSLDGCGASTMPVSPSPCVRYQACQSGYPVDFCQTSGEHDPQGSFTGPGAWGFFDSLR